MRFTIDNAEFNTPELLVLRFDQPTVEWLNFIRDNRQIKAKPGFLGDPRHNYDVVSDPIANDKVAKVVADYIDGLINSDEAIRRTKALPSVFQTSLHSQKALACVTQCEYQQKTNNGKWTDWVMVDSSLVYSNATQ